MSRRKNKKEGRECGEGRGEEKKEGKEVASEKQVERFFTAIPSSNDRVAGNLLTTEKMEIILVIVVQLVTKLCPTL